MKTGRATRESRRPLSIFYSETCPSDDTLSANIAQALFA